MPVTSSAPASASALSLLPRPPASAAARAATEAASDTTAIAATAAVAVGDVGAMQERGEAAKEGLLASTASIAAAAAVACRAPTTTHRWRKAATAVVASQTPTRRVDRQQCAGGLALAARPPMPGRLARRGRHAREREAGTGA
jgi:hypothetical protein